MIDYKELLRKYIQHVDDCEGTTFIEEGHAHTDDDKLPFSADEWKELQDLKPKYPETNIFN